MKHPFATELTRSIRSTLTRFLAILGIVGLGVGFYAGLRMTGQDMRLAADTYYDGTHLYDLRIISTLGLIDEQLDTIRELDSVEAVAGGYATDVVANIGGDRYPIRLMSFDVEVAKGSKANELGTVIESDVDTYLNRSLLVEGEWPSAADECVVSADCVLSEPVKVGDTVEVLYGTSSLDDVLTSKTFTVSGLVRSSSFPSNVDLGYTSVGSGLLKDYVYVTPEAFNSELPYTEVYVTAKGARKLASDSDEYQACVDKVAEDIEGLGLGTLRYLQIKSDAEAKLAEAQQEYDEGSAEADKELGDAEADLDSALKQLQSAESEIANGERELEAGIAELASARASAQRQLAAARATLQANEKKLNNAEAQLGMSQADINAARAQVDSAESQWNSQRSQLTSVRSDLASAQSALISLRNSVNAGGEPTADDIARIAASLASAAGTLQNLAGDGGEYAGIANRILSEINSIDLSGDPAEAYARAAEQIPGIAQRGIGETVAAIGSIDSAISRGDSEVASARSKVNQAQNARNQIDNGRAQLKQGWNSYYAQEAQANRQLDSAQRTIDEAAAKLAASKSQLAEGKAQYQKGLETYNSSRAEVDSRLGDAAAQLAAARGDIDELGEPSVYVLDRTTNSGIKAYLDDSRRIDSISTLFPSIFFLVAALVSLTTMTRMVEDERVEIGTHKALGFSTPRITAKYVVYGAIASVLGGAIGIAALSQLIPHVLEGAYGALMYSVPVLQLPLPVDTQKSLIAMGLGLAVIFIATFGAAAATLREVPATLMLPRAPKAGKRILLERITPLWSKLSFSWKVTFRNIFRYRQRLIMTVVGVAGCTALLLTGFGLHDAIWGIMPLQYEDENRVFDYDVLVDTENDASKDDIAAAAASLAEADDVDAVASFSLSNMQISSASHEDASALQVYVVDDCEAFADLIRMRERVSGQKVDFDTNSILLTEKMANRLGVGVGDTVTVFEQDEIGNPMGDGFDMVITGVVENYVYHYLYVGSTAWKEATEKDEVMSTFLVRAANAKESREAISKMVDDSDVLAAVSFIADSINTLRTSLDPINMIVVVLVGAAAALAFIVLYNLISIQLIERVREIASLKVLGFNRREVSSYLFRETIILVIVGGLVGLAAGTFLVGYVVQTAEVDSAMFARNVSLASYLYSFGLTFAFSLVVMAAVSPKLHSIDMVESLKSVD